MAQIELEKIKASSGRLYGVVWDDSTTEVYAYEIGGFGVDSSRKTVGKATSAKEAIAKAEAWVYIQRH